MIRSFPPKAFRAFSLTEILVVVGILAILLSLLFPMASRLIGGASVAKCLANQKQITAAYLSYINDNNGYLWFRPPDSTWSGGSGGLWGDQSSPNTPGYLCKLLENYGLKRAVWTAWANPITNRAQTVWYCPAAVTRSDISGHGATYFYQNIGASVNPNAAVRLAAVTDQISTNWYLKDYYGNHQDSKQLYAQPATGPKYKVIYSYLDGHSDYH